MYLFVETMWYFTGKTYNLWVTYVIKKTSIIIRSLGLDNTQILPNNPLNVVILILNDYSMGLMDKLFTNSSYLISA